MTVACPLRADEARQSVLRVEYTAQQRALVACEGALATASDPRDIRSLRLSVAWHRETLERLEQRLRG